MSDLDVLAPERRGQAGYKVDVTRGERVGRVSSEWFSRPADERFLSLTELFASVNGRAGPSGAGRGRSRVPPCGSRRGGTIPRGWR